MRVDTVENSWNVQFWERGWFGRPLLLWLWASCEWERSPELSHRHPAAGEQQEQQKTSAVKTWMFGTVGGCCQSFHRTVLTSARFGIWVSVVMKVSPSSPSPNWVFPRWRTLAMTLSKFWYLKKKKKYEKRSRDKVSEHIFMWHHMNHSNKILHIIVTAFQINLCT